MAQPLLDSSLSDSRALAALPEPWTGPSEDDAHLPFRGAARLSEKGVVDLDPLPPNCPEAKRGVLGFCLLNPAKAVDAIKAGVTTRWFPRAPGRKRLRAGEWSAAALEDYGVSASRFFEPLKSLRKAGKVEKSLVDEKWEQISSYSGNYEPQ